MATKKNKDISASQIFGLYLQSQRELKTLTTNPFYRKVPEKLALVKWKSTGRLTLRRDRVSGQQTVKHMMAYRFDQWAKDLFYQEGDEICLSVSKNIYEGFRHTIFIYTPIYQKTKTIFYIYGDDSEPDQNKVGTFHAELRETPELIFESQQNSNVSVFWEKVDFFDELDNPRFRSKKTRPLKISIQEDAIKPVRQKGKKGAIIVDHLK